MVGRNVRRHLFLHHTRLPVAVRNIKHGIRTSGIHARIAKMLRTLKPGQIAALS